jgi:hypothetical protein
LGLAGFLLSTEAPAGSPQAEMEPVDASSHVVAAPTVGMEGTYFLVHEGATLTVKPPSDGAKLRVRIAGTAAAVKDKKPHYEIRFVGDRPGFYDLRDYLAVSDDEAELPPMPVEVRTHLGGDPSAELAPVQPPPMINPVRYRLLLVLIVTLWLIPLVWLGLRRLA